VRNDSPNAARRSRCFVLNSVLPRFLQNDMGELTHRRSKVRARNRPQRAHFLRAAVRARRRAPLFRKGYLFTLNEAIHTL
jgi:hypothetical protein